MTSILFEAAIQQSDNDASNSQLHKFVSARDFSGPTLPSVAEGYLEAFCNTGSSVVRRRWIGIALAGMLEIPKVAAHIKGSTQLLHNLGAVILSSTEQEQTKIVTGVIIRQALEQGIEYGSFWSSEKVRQSAPNFPLGASAKWMHDFQKFLDALSDLALAKPTSEPSIMYLVSLFASDEFRWPESTSALPIALIEAGLLTIIAPDEYLKEFQFVEIPIEHVLSTRSEPSTLHNSQAQLTEHEPWDLIMTLKSNPWSYRLNSTQRIATEMSLMFEHSGDALEWMSSIESPKGNIHHLKTSRNLPLDASSPSIRSSDARRSLRSGPQPRRTKRVTTKKLDVKSSDPASLRLRTRAPRADLQALQELQPQHQSSTSKHTTYSKGKLPRVSQAAKQKIFKKLNAESEDLDVAMRNAHTDLLGSASVTSSPEKKLQGSKAGPGKKAVVKSKSKARVSHIKHVADDDEDFIPTQTRAEKKNTKRKAAPDTTAEIKPRKRSRVQQGQKCPLAKPLESPSSVTSSQYTLIGGLLGARGPTNLSDLPFKKPILPARAAQTPSTPTKPNTTPVKALSRSKTPVEARRRSDDDALQYMASSPPVADETEDSNEWLDVFAETAILSSNSKPTPASPHAASTAISGHADCNDVASEKKTGDWQTAKSDPFSRRSTGKKATSFIRRLTGEESTNANDGPAIFISNQMPATAVAGSSTPEAETPSAASQRRPQKMPWEKKRPFHPKNSLHTLPEDFKINTSTQKVDIVSQQVADTTSSATRSSRPIQDTKTQRTLELVLQQDHDDVGENIKHRGIPSISTALSKDDGTTSALSCNEAAAENNVPETILNTDRQIVDFTQPAIEAGQQPTSALRNSIEETQQATEYPRHTAEEIQQLFDDMPIDEAPNEDDVDLGDVTLVGDGESGRQAVNDFNVSPVKFRSSQLYPASSSSHSSTSALPEPLTDSPVPSSEAEEMQWKASLQPYQRNLNELLIRTSKRVMRHIVDNETSVTDIAEMYAQDGEHVLSTLIRRHDIDYMHVFQEMENTKANLRKELERAAKQMAKDKRRVSSIA
ncbi:hypothetical protein G6011_01524 [Alternaria panax]|uniref:Uncharacterized protein n=1 Tax=Alternaria panax TaxID=48097 RepID=A0AAD4NVW8_9PLEO|nr:hypothetical protein G6011_01524 [Alternaria panax]